MMKLRLWLFPLWMAGALAWGASAHSKTAVEGAKASRGVQLPAGCKATLHFTRLKVAAGGIANDAHRSDFWIEVRDAQGKPRSGVAVDLPRITRGGQGLSRDEIDGTPADNRILARLEWAPSTPRVQSGKMRSQTAALTGPDGRARGRFTSGKRPQRVEFSAVGSARSSILQVLSEDDTDENDEFPLGEPAEERTILRFREGNKWVPITGHHLSLEAADVRLTVIDPKLGPDKNGDGQPDGLSQVVTFSRQKPQEKGWKTWLKWCQFDALAEVEPGVYVGTYQINMPEFGFIDGKKIVSLNDMSYDVCDDDCSDDE